MPLSTVAEWVLSEALGAVVSIFGYWTALIVVPLFSLGRIAIEHEGRPHRLRPRWHGFHRAEGGGLVINPDMASFLGILFWVVFGVGVYLLQRYGGG